MTSAMEAKQKQGMAQLEEFLQEKYVENYDKFGETENTKVYVLESLYPQYFYIPSLDGIGNLRYVVDSSGNALYLINKKNLPNEIKSGLVGGDAGSGTYAEYAGLKDVYGVTSDLKVYYCSNGKETILGISEEDLDKDNPLRPVVKSSQNSSLYGLLESFDEDGNSELSAEEVKSIDSLTITSENDIKDLKEFYNFPSLKELYLESASLDSFDGIENCAYLHLISCTNCVIPNYSAIGKLGERLDTLYFYDLDDSELEKICNKDVGIGDSPLKNLKNLAFSGTKSNIGAEIIYNTEYYNASMINYTIGKRDFSKLITNLKYLDNLNIDTKKAVNNLSVAFNKITSLSGLESFENLYLLRAEENLLTNLDGIGNCKKLEILDVVNNKLTMLTKFSEGSKLRQLGVTGNSDLITLSGLENCSELTHVFAMDCKIGYLLEDSSGKKSTDGLSSLQNKSKLFWLELSNNSNIVWVDYIKNDSKLWYLRLTGCENIESSSMNNLGSLLAQVGKRYYIPSKYNFALLTENSNLLDLSDQELEKNDFLSLKNYTNLTTLSLKNLKIYEFGEDGTKKYITISQGGGDELNSLFNEALSPLTKIVYLQLYGCSDLTTISFVENMNNLRELDLRNSGITDLSILERKRNNNTMELHTLAVNTMGTNLSTISNTINQMYGFSGSEYWCRVDNTIGGGILCDSKSVWETLNGSTVKNLKVHRGGLTVDNPSEVITVDLSSCGSLEKLTLNGTITFKLPSSIKDIDAMNAYCPVLSDGTNLVEFRAFGGPSLDSLINQANKISSIKELNGAYIYSRSSSLGKIGLLKNKGVEKIILNFRDSYDSSRIADATGFEIPSTLKEFTLTSSNKLTILNMPNSLFGNQVLEGGPSLTSFTLTNTNLDNFSFLNDLTNVTKIDISDNMMRSITFNGSNLRSLVNLNMNSNKISSLRGIDMFTSLTTLDLTNNLITDRSAYMDESGETVNYNNLSEIVKLHPSKGGNLQTLKISGNNGILDYSPLKSVSWNSIDV